jgi:hypothetical protein
MITNPSGHNRSVGTHGQPVCSQSESAHANLPVYHVPDLRVRLLLPAVVVELRSPLISPIPLPT